MRRPSTNTWVTNHASFTARYAHTATLLSNGQNMVWAGGITNPNTNQTTAIATWFSPQSNLNMINDRAHHAATRMRSGAVLVIGGYKLSAGDSITAVERAVP